MTCIFCLILLGWWGWTTQFWQGGVAGIDILHITWELLSKSPLHWGREGLFTSFDAANGQWSVVWIIWIHLEDCIHDLRDTVRVTKIPFLVVKKKKTSDISTWRILFFWPPKPLIANLRHIGWNHFFATCLPPKKVWGHTKSIQTLTRGYNSMNRAWWNCYLPQYAAERRCFFCLWRSCQWGGLCSQYIVCLYDGIVIQLWFIILTLLIFFVGLPCCFYCYWYNY